MPPRDGSEVGWSKIPVARGNDIGLLLLHGEPCRASPLFALIATLRAGQAIQFILIDFDFARLLHLVM